MTASASHGAPDTRRKLEMIYPSRLSRQGSDPVGSTHLPHLGLLLDSDQVMPR
jgi:hypothetical protein